MDFLVASSAVLVTQKYLLIGSNASSTLLQPVMLRRTLCSWFSSKHNSCRLHVLPLLHSLRLLHFSQVLRNKVIIILHTQTQSLTLVIIPSSCNVTNISVCPFHFVLFFNLLKFFSLGILEIYLLIHLSNADRVHRQQNDKWKVNV